MQSRIIEKFIEGMPKAELHLHIEGTFEPEQMFEIAKRNNKQIRYNSVDELRAAYAFNNLQEFLDIYYEGANVLINQQDFYDLTYAYLQRVAKQNVIHTEIFFDPQTHTSRGISFSTIFNGIYNALKDGETKLGITSKIIMCFLRHLDADDAMKTLHESLEFKDKIVAVGLDSSEVGNPPEKFQEVFRAAREYGYLTVAHAGEEGPASYIWGALDLLKVSRVDHGNKCLDDDKLVEKLITEKMPLTVCPLSNLKLRVVKEIENHPLRKLMNKNLIVTVNSDDPAYFGGYMNENYLAVQKALNLTKDEIIILAKNAFNASFLTEAEKQSCLLRLNNYIEEFDNN